MQEAIGLADVRSGSSRPELDASLRSLRPPFLLALAEDARIFRFHRDETLPPARGLGKWLDALRLAFEADDFAALALYRVRTALDARSVPVLPRLLHFLSVAMFKVRIGDFIVLGEGAYIPHGNIVVDGITVIGRHVVLAPWTTLGVVQGSPVGPKLADDVFVGTGAKVLGSIAVGEKARIGANSVVISDVPAGATAIGAPAKVISVNGDQPSVSAWPEDAPKV